MTAANFVPCFLTTEQYEGWRVYTDDPYDPGGATYSGVTQRAFNGWLRMMGLPPREVRFAKDEELETIGNHQYWQPVRGDFLFAGLDLVLFDIAFNSGPITAIKFLQQALGVAVDGQFGLETIGALAKVNDRAALIHTICARRQSFWHSLKTYWRFGRGWSARGVGIETKAIVMLAKGT